MNTFLSNMESLHKNNCFNLENHSDILKVYWSNIEPEQNCICAGKGSEICFLVANSLSYMIEKKSEHFHPNSLAYIPKTYGTQ